MQYEHQEKSSLLSSFDSLQIDKKMKMNLKEMKGFGMLLSIYEKLENVKNQNEAVRLKLEEQSKIIQDLSNSASRPQKYQEDEDEDEKEDDN
mmetsp:Transcript_1908/g.1820  ORF Transcript_1908/g.1820 Transcript_1908/m.1820 type:complete len:92 (+) Transcript_1908:811-1086(+)